MIRRNQFQNLSKVLAFFVALIAVGAVAQTNNDDNIFSVADTNDCIGSDNYGDMYLMACTGSSKLRFSILGQHAHEGGLLVASGGPFDGKCMYADGNFWPKLKTCDLNDSNMNWFFLNGMFTNNEGLCLKHGQINPTNRLTVETCTATDTNVWSSIRLASLASVGGDPHFVTFSGKSFSYHGMCDLMLLMIESFLGGLGLEIHVRTTRIDNAKSGYSFISGAALRVGQDVLEVKDDGSVLVNGDVFDIDDNLGGEFAGHSITKHFKGSKKNIVVYDLTFGAGATVQVRTNMRTGMIFLDVSKHISDDAVGLLGSPAHDYIFFRDGAVDMTGQWNSFGESFQINADDPKLFEDKDRVPQYPAGCIYRSQSEKKNGLRRQLLEESVSMDVASKACAETSGSKKSFCIEDVMLTGDVELAQDSFYHN